MIRTFLQGNYFHRFINTLHKLRSFFLKNWDSLHARLNSQYKAWSYKKNKQKRLRHTENLFRENLQLTGVC